MSRYLNFIAQTALIAGVASFSVRSGAILSPEGFRPKIFEIALVVAGLATVLWAAQHLGEIKTFWSRRKNILKLILVLFLGMVAGTLWGLARFGFIPNTGVMIEYGRFITAFATLLLMLFWLDQSPGLSRWIIAGFFIPLGYGILIVIPRLAEYFDMIEGSGRLRGFHNDPNYFATLLLIPFCLCFAYLIKGQNWRMKMLALTGAVIASSLLWWAGSRGSWFAMIVGPFLSLFLIKPLRLSSVTIFALSLLSIHVAGFLLLPTHAQQAALSKVLPHYAATFQQTGLATLPQTLAENPSSAISFIAKENRFAAWPRYAIQTLKHPVGFGPAYAQISIQNYPIVSHNILLETLLVAGWTGFLATILLTRQIKKALGAALIKAQSYHPIGIATSLITLLLALFFLESLALRWLWILIALSLTPPKDQGSR